MNSMQGFDALNDSFTEGLIQVGDMLSRRADARTVAALVAQYNALVARSNAKSAEFNALVAEYNDLARKHNGLVLRVSQLEALLDAQE
jgi:hypothetical protein